MPAVGPTQSGAPPKTDPAYYVKLLARDGGKVKLGSGTNIDLTHYCEKLVFEDKGSCADKLTLTVINDSLEFFEDEGAVFRKGNILEVSWGYPFLLSPARQMVIDKVEGFTTLKVEAHSLGMLMNRVTRTKVYRNIKHSDLVKKILTSYGYSNFQFIQDTVTTPSSTAQVRMTDAQLMQHLANQYGYDFFIDFDGPHFHEKAYTQAPSKIYTWYFGDNCEITNIKIKNGILSQPGAIVTTGRDPITKKDYVNVHTNDTVKRPSLAPSVTENVSTIDNAIPQSLPPGDLERYVSPEVNYSGTVLVCRSPDSQDQAKTRGDATFKRAMQATIKLTATVIGNPRLLAKTIIEIRNIGTKMSGKYYIDKVKHTVSKSGYMCDLECHRDGTSDSQNTPNKGQQNTQSPAPDDVVTLRPSAETDDSSLFNVTSGRNITVSDLPQGK